MLPTIRPMTTRQRILVDPDHACDYHLVSRCVRAGFLSGYDARTQRDYSYREKWVVQRLETLVRCFAVSLYGHSVKSDHFHLVVRYDPQGCHEWSDEEVARRWVDAFQPMGPGREMQRRRQKTYAATLADPARRERARRALGSLAAFMKHLKQPISRRANLEDHSQGRFFEQGFYSGALLNEEALEAAMAYVDLSHMRGMLETRIVARSKAPMAGWLKVNSAKALAGYLKSTRLELDQRRVVDPLTEAQFPCR